LGLEDVEAGLAAELLRARESRETATDQKVVPAGAVLIEEEDRLSAGTDPRPQARRLDLHESDEAVDLGFVGGELGEDPSEAERLFAERRTDPVRAARRAVAFVEDEVDHLEHGCQTCGELSSAWDLERDALLGERPLRSHDPLRDRRLRDQERSRDLFGREATEETEREGDARVAREHGVAAREDEAEEVVADLVV